VASAEVEGALTQHPEVQEAGVIAVPSELTEDDVAAFVVPRPGAALDTDELIAWCGQRLAPFKVPRYLWLVDSLPKTETQRIEKHRLREEARRLMKRA
jgi:crotonobetaine/carnitine-CoA ligase